MIKIILFTLLYIVIFTQSLSAQGQTAELSDPHRISYEEVFDNMHYNQIYRPQVHYTPITGEIADATGLIRYKGKYHLFYMYDEWSRRRRDNKNWGHATSSDLIYWEQKPQILNTVVDNAPGSGSGIVDWNNTLGLRTGPEKTMVVFYTDYGRGPSLAFSKDGGKTWIRHKENPILPGKDDFRDPLVFWYKPDQSWRMVMYEERGFSFYKSNNLTDWEYLSRMDGFYECPDFLHMPVDGDDENKKWVLIGGDGSYYVGEFDGTQFTNEGEKKYLGGENNAIYATQTWKQSYEGDGPFYQMGFMHLTGQPSHDSTWSQQQIFPVELTLKTVNGEIKLLRNPVQGIKKLRYDGKFWENLTINPNEDPFEEIEGDVFEINAEIEIGNSEEIVFNIRGEEALYDVNDQELHFRNNSATVVPNGDRIDLSFIIDRSSVEIFANEGEVSFAKYFYPDPNNLNISLTSKGGSFHINEMELYRLESIWLDREQELGYEREKVHYESID